MIIIKTCIDGRLSDCIRARPEQVHVGAEACNAAYGVTLGETANGACLGGNSKYSNESFEEVMINDM